MGSAPPWSWFAIAAVLVTNTARAEVVRSKDPIAIALVINGQESWVGNEDIERDPTSIHAGALKSLQIAIDEVDLASCGPAGSKATVISYANGAEIVVPMTSLRSIHGTALGLELDYYNKRGSDLVRGVRLAYTELVRVPAPRKAIIVVGDGTDSDGERAKPLLSDLKNELASSNIEVFALVYTPGTERSERPVVITSMVPTAKRVPSGRGLVAGLAEIVQRIQVGPPDEAPSTPPGAGNLRWLVAILAALAAIVVIALMAAARRRARKS